MQLIEITNKALADEFINVNVKLNRQDPNYIRPLDKDIHQVFDPQQNKTFRNGKLIRWILRNEKGDSIGRIAAFTNKKYRNKGDDVTVGGIGFFDCINDQTAANILFDTAKAWLTKEGCQAMDGPINFGERDRWWGLVVKGHQPPLYGMNYNPPYYQQLFETYGFQPFFNQICMGQDPREKLSDKIFERHALYAANPDFSARMIDKSNLRKYAGDFATVYNAAWAGHGGMKQMKAEQAYLLFKQMKPVMDKRLIWFAYHKEEPIAVFVNLPDLNQWFKYLNGKFDLLHKLKFLWIKATKKCHKFVGIVFGVVPEWQGKGIDAYIIRETGKMVQHIEYSDYEMQWIGDFNPKMLNVAKSLGDTHESRRLTTYRYLFDREKPFHRHPILA